MTRVTITLDPSGPIQRELQEELLRYVSSLKTAKYYQETQHAEPGKLGGVEPQTVTIIVELTTAILSFVSAIMAIVTQFEAASAQDESSPDESKGKHKLAEIEVEGEKISLPVREETGRRYLKKVSEKVGEEPVTKNRPTKRQPASATAKPKKQSRN